MKIFRLIYYTCVAVVAAIVMAITGDWDKGSHENPDFTNEEE